MILIFILLSSWQPSDNMITMEEQTKLIDQVASVILERYIDRTVAEKAIAKLREAAPGDSLDPADWAAWANGHLFQTSGDHHLMIWYEPDRQQQGQIFKATNNYGQIHCRTLPGQVAYIRLDEFSTKPEAESLLAHTIAWAQHHDAILLDLRFNRGGSGQRVLQLLSHLLEKPTLINQYRFRYKKQVVTYRTPKNKEPLWRDKPLAVLTSSHTASAAEILVNAVQTYDLGSIVGETTMGLGNVADVEVLNHGLALLYTHGFDDPPAPGKPWQGVGLAPDIDCPADQAMERAHRHLLAGQRRQDIPKQWLEAALNYCYNRPGTSTEASTAQQFGPYTLVQSANGWQLTKRHFPAIALVPCGDRIFCQSEQPLQDQVWLRKNQLWWVSPGGKVRKFDAAR